MTPHQQARDAAAVAMFDDPGDGTIPDAGRSAFRPVAYTPPTPTKPAPDRSWVEDANCRGVDPDLFYPERGGDDKAPKAVCAACTVREQCLEYAVRHNELYGIWGGLSENQRRRMRWGGGKCGTVAGYMRHRRSGEDACSLCLKAWAARPRNDIKERGARTA